MSMTGRFAVAKAGHDKGVLYVVVAQEGDFVYLSDGRLKAPDRPKRKRRKHIQPINAEVSAELKERLLMGKTVWPEELKLEIKRYESGKQTIIMEEMYVKE